MSQQRSKIDDNGQQHTILCIPLDVWNVMFPNPYSAEDDGSNTSWLYRHVIPLTLLTITCKTLYQLLSPHYYNGLHDRMKQCRKVENFNIFEEIIPICIKWGYLSVLQHFVEHFKFPFNNSVVKYYKPYKSKRPDLSEIGFKSLNRKYTLLKKKYRKIE
jgi:hypothetical protein